MTRYLLVIGAQRSGTTYLYEVLDSHPDIAMAKPARPEPKFLLDPQQWRRGLSWYEATYFAGAGHVPVHGEKSTSYIESAHAASRAAALMPDMVIVALLRDPVARAVSNWRFSTASGLEDRPLHRALADNLDGSRDWSAQQTSVSPFAYLERGRYLECLEPWLAAFGDRVTIAFTDEVTRDAAAVAALFEAVAVDSTHRPALLGDVVNATDGPADELDTGLVDALRSYFSASDARLRAHVGRPLPWDPATSQSTGS